MIQNGHMPNSLQRSIQTKIKHDLERKIIILAGPRQCGKTTLAKSLSSKSDYLNFDNLDDRSQILRREWDRKKELIIFDELHKMPKWKSWLKGIYDKEGGSPPLLVTGSAKLDAFKKTGDSLAGRHFYYRLHPFDVKELVQAGHKKNPEDILETLVKVGGYPEPYLEGDRNEYQRWRKGHLDLILRQDLVDYETVRDLQSVQILIELLRSRVGSGISVNALATELQKDHKTIQRWLNILEDLFVIFKITPFSKEISRSLKKEPKYYFYDSGLVDGDNGVKLENVIACSLLKEVHRLIDVEGIELQLNYLKVKGGREIDFLLHSKDKSIRPILIESKYSDADASANFKLFETHFKSPKKIQLVQTLKRNFSTQNQIEVIKASEWLADLSLV